MHQVSSLQSLWLTDFGAHLFSAGCGCCGGVYVCSVYCVCTLEGSRPNLATWLSPLYILGQLPSINWPTFSSIVTCKRDVAQKIIDAGT